MAGAHSDVTRKLVQMLRTMGHHELANQLPNQPLHGRCACTPACTSALTAPPGSSGTYLIWLELGSETIGQASHNPDRVVSR